MKLPILLSLLVVSSAHADVRIISADCGALYNALNLPAERELVAATGTGGSIPSRRGGSTVKVGRGYEAYEPTIGPLLPAPGVVAEARCTFKGEMGISGFGLTVTLDKETGEHLWQKLNVPAVLTYPQSPTDQFSKNVGRFRLNRGFGVGSSDADYVLQIPPPVTRPARP